MISAIINVVLAKKVPVLYLEVVKPKHTQDSLVLENERQLTLCIFKMLFQ